MTCLDCEAAVIALLKAENDLRQLEAENRWLRRANKGLSDELEKVRKLLPTGTTA